MKAYKLAPLFFILYTSSSFALDCSRDETFSLNEEHWIHQQPEVIQFYLAYYLSSKTLHECLEEPLPQNRLHIKRGLENVVGTSKLRSLESEAHYMFDVKQAFAELGIDPVDKKFLEKLQTYQFPNQ